LQIGMGGDDFITGRGSSMRSSRNPLSLTRRVRSHPRSIVFLEKMVPTPEILRRDRLQLLPTTYKEIHSDEKCITTPRETVGIVV
jgi:hypothetical protein